MMHTFLPTFDIASFSFIKNCVDALVSLYQKITTLCQKAFQKVSVSSATFFSFRQKSSEQKESQAYTDSRNLLFPNFFPETRLSEAYDYDRHSANNDLFKKSEVRYER